MLKLKKGIKIRKSFEKLYSNTLLLIFLSLSLLMLFLYVKLTSKSISQLVKYQVNELIFLIALTSIISIIIIIFLHIFVKGSFQRIKNIQKLCKVIINNQFYIKETFDKKEITMYFPDFYLYENDDEIRVSIRLDGSKFYDRFLKLGNLLADLYESEMQSKVIEHAFVIYKLVKIKESQRLNIENDIHIDGYKLPLMEGLNYDLSKYSSILVCGSTGSGKTTLFLWFIKCFLKMDAIVKVLDGKSSKLSKLENVLGVENVAYTKEQIMGQLKEACQEIDKRYAIIRGSNTSESFDKNYVDFGMKLYVICFDEYLVFLDSCINNSKIKERDEAREYFNKIKLQGRECGVLSVDGVQRGDGEYITTLTRDNYDCLIGLKLSPTGYKMIFPESERIFTSPDRAGIGYLMIKGQLQEVRTFFSPYLKKNFNFIKDFKKIIQERDSTMKKVTLINELQENNIKAERLEVIKS